MPLTRQDLLGWTSEERIGRAGRRIVAGWDIPAEHKEMLTEVGIPQSDIVDHAAYQREAAPALTTANRDPLYRLTVADQDANGRIGLSFGVEPGTGTVFCVDFAGEALFANSSIPQWLQSLHLYGYRTTMCDLLVDPDGHEEEAVIAELQRLADEIQMLDPPAFARYEGYFWPPTLDRWLY
jgi:hypothetical protein